jgi:SSS family solute:Na+ symporter
MSHLYAAVVGAIILTLLLFRSPVREKQKTKADYLVAGRSLIFTLLSSSRKEFEQAVGE